MSEGSKQVDAIMAMIASRGIEAGHYNRIYEAVDALVETGRGQRALALVRAVDALLPTDADDGGTT